MTDKKLKLLIEKLQSEKEEEVVFTIKQLRNTGNSIVLPYLFDRIINNESKEIHAAVIELLNDLKDDSAKNEIIDALKNKKYKPIHKELLVSCWQSRIDYSEYVDVFIDFFKKSDFGLAFEAFTVIDNFEPKVEIPQIQQSIDLLKSDIYKFKDTDKEQLYVELIHILESFQ